MGVWVDGGGRAEEQRFAVAPGRADTISGWKLVGLSEEPRTDSCADQAGDLLG